MKKQQIRIIIFHEFKFGRKATQAAEIIEVAWGAGTTCTRTVQRWFKRFRSGDLSLEEEDGRRRPSRVDDDEHKALVKANSRTTVREFRLALGVCAQTVSTHLDAIGKVKNLDKWVFFHTFRKKTKNQGKSGRWYRKSRRRTKHE